MRRSFEESYSMQYGLIHGGVIKWPFVRGIHRSPVDSPPKGQWHGTLMCSLICAWTNRRDTGDLKRYRARYDVAVMIHAYLACFCVTLWRILSNYRYLLTQTRCNCWHVGFDVMVTRKFTFKHVLTFSMCFVFAYKICISMCILLHSAFLPHSTL